MFSIYYSHFIARLVVFLVIAQLIYLHSVAILVVFDCIVMLVVFDQIAVMVILFGLPLAFSLLMCEYALIALRLLQLEILIVLVLALIVYFCFKISFGTQIACLSVSVLGGRFEFMAC
jgi:hypothetical protein